jgi:hypothetical protein
VPLVREDLPPFTVASLAMTTQSRPEIEPMPVTMLADGTSPP